MSVRPFIETKGQEEPTVKVITSASMFPCLFAKGSSSAARAARTSGGGGPGGGAASGDDIVLDDVDT